MVERKKINPSTVEIKKVHDRPGIEKSTLLNPTKVWLQKCKTKRDPEVAAQGICYVKDIPKL